MDDDFTCGMIVVFMLIIALLLIANNEQGKTIQRLKATSISHSKSIECLSSSIRSLKK